MVLHGLEECLEELVGGADVGVEVHEVDASSDERDLRGLEVRMERHGAVPQADDGGGMLAVLAESVRGRRCIEKGRAGAPRPLRNRWVTGRVGGRARGAGGRALQ